MKKLVLSLGVIFALGVSVISCRETEKKTETTTIEKAEKETEGKLEKTGKAIDDAAEKTKEAGKAIDDAVKEISDDN